MKEIKSLTGLRGVAAFYVLTGHIGLLSDKNGIFYKVLPLRNIVEHGYISVDIFFILSGFVLMFMYQEQFKDGYTSWFAKFMQKRFARIYPLYLFCLIVYGVLYAFVLNVPNNHVPNMGISDILTNLLLFQSVTHSIVVIPTSWSLSTEWVAYLMFPILCFVCARIKNWKALIIFLLISMVSLYMIGSVRMYANLDTLLPFQKPLNVYSGIPSLVRCIIGVCYGAVIFNFSKITSFSKYQSVFFLLSVLLITLTYYDYVTFLILGMLVWSLAEDRGPIARFLSSKIVYKLGLWSYSIYLLHPIILGPLREYLFDFLSEHSIRSLAFPISLLCTLGVTVFSSFLSYSYIEMPAKRYFQKRFSK